MISGVCAPTERPFSGRPPVARARFSQPVVAPYILAPPLSSKSWASKCERIRSGMATAGASRAWPA